MLAVVHIRGRLYVTIKRLLCNSGGSLREVTVVVGFFGANNSLDYTGVGSSASPTPDWNKYEYPDIFVDAGDVTTKLFLGNSDGSPTEGTVDASLFGAANFLDHSEVCSSASL